MKHAGNHFAMSYFKGLEQNINKTVREKIQRGSIFQSPSIITKIAGQLHYDLQKVTLC